MNILHQVPNTILIMMTLGPDSQSYILREAMFRGIHESRLLFLPKVCLSIQIVFLYLFFISLFFYFFFKN